MSAEMTIEGAKELELVMRQLPSRLQKKHLRRATNQGAALLRKELRSAAPFRSGRLRRNIKSKGRRGGRFYVKASVFVRTRERDTNQKREISGRFMATGDADRYDKNDAYYWRFLEYGTKHMAAQPFIRPTAERNFPRVVRHVVDETDRGVREEIDRVKT